VAYQSDETGRTEIYIASFPDARRRLQVTSDGGSFPEWGPDGRELFYLSGDGMLTVVGLRNGPEGLEPSSPQRLFPVTAREHCPNMVLTVERNEPAKAAQFLGKTLYQLRNARVHGVVPTCRIRRRQGDDPPSQKPREIEYDPVFAECTSELCVHLLRGKRAYDLTKVRDVIWSRCIELLSEIKESCRKLM
jgi:hypothetical protein